ncbi:MAG TPA: ribonuclease domain-containing protein [Lysobacter sp.]|nr:ribonuclease domain-containing protein [Lysobacter sp.]
MRRNRPLWLLAAILLVGLWAWSQSTDNGVVSHAPSTAPTTQTADVPPPAIRDAAPRERAGNDRPVYPAFLPREAHAVLDAIARGGPYEYRQDGGVFQNRERELPSQPRGYYREFTVDTPGARDRGARRIVTGGDPPVEYFYTDDHYRSFRRFEVAR